MDFFFFQMIFLLTEMIEIKKNKKLLNRSNKQGLQPDTKNNNDIE